MMKERRALARLDIKLKVKWKNMLHGTGKVAESIAMTKNISGGGLCLIIYKKAVAVDDWLQLEIELFAGRVLATKGKVVWVNQCKVSGEEGDKMYDIGVVFKEISDADRQVILEFVHISLEKRNLEDNSQPSPI